MSYMVTVSLWNHCLRITVNRLTDWLSERYIVLLAGFRCWTFAVTRTLRGSSVHCLLLSASTDPSSRVALFVKPYKPDVSRACATTASRGRKCCAVTSFHSTTTFVSASSITLKKAVRITFSLTGSSSAVRRTLLMILTTHLTSLSVAFCNDNDTFVDSLT